MRGYDATFSAPKSVSVLFALGDQQVRERWWRRTSGRSRRCSAGSRPMLTLGCVAAGRWSVSTPKGSWRRVSSAHQPQARPAATYPCGDRQSGPSPDGRWLALDARTIKIDQRTLSALYHANLRSELTRRLGVRWQPTRTRDRRDHRHRRRRVGRVLPTHRDLERRLKRKLDRFRPTLAREPTSRERWRLEREAAIDSHRKRHGDTPADLRQEWRPRMALGWDPE